MIAAAKRRAELADLQLAVKEREIKVDVIRRVAETEPDPVTALEVISVATHRGKLPPNLYTRRKPEQSPLEAMALAMLQKRLEEDPTDALDRILERRERLEEAADRLSGGRGHQVDEGTGNAIVDVARALANSPLGEAVGQVLGAGMQQRMAEAAAASGHQLGAPSPAAIAAAAGTTPPPTDPLASPAPAAPAASTSAPPAGGSRLTSFRVSMALRVLRTLGPAERARWIFGQADQHPELAELVDPFMAADPPAVPLILEAFITEASAGGDPAVLEWLPLVEYFRDNPEWTLETHAAMRELASELDDEDAAAG